MAYDEYFADRVRQVFADKHVSFEEKKMMGGLCFMVDDKMCVGVHTDKKDGIDRLMVRLDPEIYQDVLLRPGAEPMDFTGRPMKGFIFVTADGVDDEADLEQWVQLALDFNPKAKSSKKKRKNSS